MESSLNINEKQKEKLQTPGHEMIISKKKETSPS